MNARLISAPSLSPEEQKNRLAEFFREYWGTQQINDYHTDTTFHVNHKNSIAIYDGQKNILMSIIGVAAKYTIKSGLSS
ncbi:hypothetical protein [Salmonella enterica]|uniref:hypothetical protein n=1 Tax=Salmonella enterica TaxID=28901 RepID=UPI0003F7BE45|nr:hypothetical protein [Salmonella enterica]